MKKDIKKILYEIATEYGGITVLDLTDNDKKYLNRKINKILKLKLPNP